LQPIGDRLQILGRQSPLVPSLAPLLNLLDPCQPLVWREAGDFRPLTGRECLKPLEVLVHHAAQLITLEVAFDMLVKRAQPRLLLA